MEKSKIEESEDIERVSREMKIMKKPSQANIARLYEIVTDPTINDSDFTLDQTKFIR